ncbi:hypothetical protein LCGC14_2278310 [marine sediment metagenome]|uniref:Uncharacterized protein n=1 Tax=marine sediment metagenome TaxID=412755 RepID=A0A0F9CUW0_9ZZZZ
MTKKARKPTESELSKQWAYRPLPTKTPQELMLHLDAEHMVSLLHQLLSCMPGTFREALKERGFLQFKVKDHDVLITSRAKFEKNNGIYGKVCNDGPGR